MKRYFMFSPIDGSGSGKTLKGQVSEAQIAEWKSKSPLGIYAVEVADEHIVYFRNPTFNDLNCAYAKTDWNKQLDKWKELADVTYLGGSEEVMNNERLLSSILGDIQVAAKGEETKLVKL